MTQSKGMTTTPMGTPVEPAAPCPAWPEYDGELGASIIEDDDITNDGDTVATVFHTWAPSATAMTLRLFAAGSEDEPAGADPIVTTAMQPGRDGSWSARCPGIGHGVYYDYLVTFRDGTVIRTADPWARAAGVNGRRSMVVDLRRTDPDGWEHDRRPRARANELVIWETHIGDFSNDPHSGVPAEHRGTYLAFTHPATSVDGEGDFPTCVAYLKRLGVTAVQLMPFYDYGSIDESIPRDDPRHGFNWGYDPLNVNVPEGSYSTDPFRGDVRIRECKRMIQALHTAGIKVIMDVVYNHMYSTNNWFERMLPGYALRRSLDGRYADGSACSNDVASEHPMMRRAIVDSVRYWAEEYHVDGFRFDLMGLIDVDTMNAIRAALDALPGGESILMHGEPWSARPTAVEPGVILADKHGMPCLDPRIGAFCDATRDAVRGHVFLPGRPGYLTGASASHAAAIRAAVDGWRGTPHEHANVGQTIQYVSAHDDHTLWDKLCALLRDRPGGADYYEAKGECDDLLAANRLAAGIVFTAAGVPFLLGGEEFARTKHGVSNSYVSPAALNWLDWRRARRMSALVDHYAALIALRRGDPRYFAGARTVVPRDDDAVVFRVGDDCVAINPSGEARSQTLDAGVGVDGDGGDGGVDGAGVDGAGVGDDVQAWTWRCVLRSVGAGVDVDGVNGADVDAGAGEDVGEGAGDGVHTSAGDGAGEDAAVAGGPGERPGSAAVLAMPPRSITVWRRRHA